VKVFGDRVKELRINKNWTQEDLAKRINKPRSTVTNYENGRIPRDKLVMSNLADVLETTVDYLMGRTDRPGLTDNKEEALDLEELFKKPLLYKGKEIPDEELDFFLNLADRILSDLERRKR
jgi:transcriptional regulator with XRE-family HTH domain